MERVREKLLNSKKKFELYVHILSTKRFFEWKYISHQIESLWLVIFQTQTEMKTGPSSILSELSIVEKSFYFLFQKYIKY